MSSEMQRRYKGESIEQLSTFTNAVAAQAGALEDNEELEPVTQLFFKYFCDSCVILFWLFPNRLLPNCWQICQRVYLHFWILR